MMSSLETQYKRIQANGFLNRTVIQEATFSTNKIYKSILKYFRDTSRTMIKFKINTMRLTKEFMRLKRKKIHFREESTFQEVKGLKRNMILMRLDLQALHLNDI